jgi:hypothetical protein
MSSLKTDTQTVRVIYDENDGEVLHAHLITTLDGGRAPSEPEIARSTQRIGDLLGVRSDNLASLDVSLDEWGSRSSDQVDLDAKTLGTG